ncbi:4-(cytidine 5'-diphospho)-2-C-methyl-D-erythritol kinase [Geobacter pelophilus]|uniref:4-diphosphocytidyl-2-C-methyl-D-erythritol kinase n=1 Tax=Geoanaerobacter pelophilus TaxID=60036 RepID=A0AAW4LAH2_9BACT|nr:4-(cytidine 5'-diphospho)-2-C-methyl-D-erythritol kinase [Geoanaerobacter pelophilus]MBT0666083.1 4-(cytidine 5'-diphospho)-2-C-methyl-D-erythritol kinase [Geoanaerobacter pelophilus]
MPNKSVELSAPAKVNYRLDVLSKRPDGYHDLRMIMQRVDLCDTIRINLTGSTGITVTCNRNSVPDGPENIAWRAAKAVLDLSQKPVGVAIDIDKKIPVAAGLGGGSSDAATVLMGLNNLLELGLSTEQLMEIGVTLGADVPFFIFGDTSIAEGIGEKLTRIEKIPRPWIVLVNPNVHVSTAWVYKNLQLTIGKDVNTMPNFFDNIAELCAVLGNDLESVTISRFPVIRDIKNLLIQYGAAASLMSGSGPTVFGIFEDEAAAREAAKKIATEHNWFTAAVKTL